jgi:histidinol phosphatase-like PHP family hydrolase
MPEPSELDQLYRNIFSSSEGLTVLGDILTKGHYGLTLDGENRDQIAEYNFALMIATRAGVFDNLYRQLGLVKEKNGSEPTLL